MHSMTQIIREAQRYPWAILPEKLAEIKAFVARRLAGAETPVEERARLVAAAEERQRAQSYGAVAVIPVYGTIGQKMNLMMAMSGGTSTELLGKQIREAAANPDIAAIVLRIDSPGGSVYGLPELHAEMMAARAEKPIVASVDPFMASAALWIGSGASEIAITPSGQAGSLGVLMMHVDQSAALEQEGLKVTFIHAGKYKVEGNPYEPLDEAARASIQEMVDHYYSMFVRDVAKGRGMSTADVKKNFGEGRMLTAQEAKSAGMIDRIEAFDDTVARYSKRSRPRGAKALEERLEMGGKFLR